MRRPLYDFQTAVCPKNWIAPFRECLVFAGLCVCAGGGGGDGGALKNAAP